MVRMTTFTSAEPVVLGDAAGGVEPVDAGHADVHEHDVGAMLERQAHRLLAVGRLADDGDVVLRVEQRPEAAPHQRLVVGDDDGDHGASTGRCAADAEARRRRTGRPRPCRRAPPPARACR